MDRRNLGTWTPAIVAGAVFAGVIAVTLAAGSDGGASGSPPADPSVAAVVGDSTLPIGPVTTTTVPGFTTTTLAFDQLTADIVPFSQGAQVEALQQRLQDMHFDPGPVDGYFGEATRAAVWAYKKLVLQIPREQVDGTVTPEVWASMHGNVEVLPRRPNGTTTHLEVYLTEQVAVLFEENRPTLISHVSTGSGETWTEEISIDPGTPENEGTEPITKVLTGTSITPGGIYTFNRKYVEGDGWRTGSLGRMYKPVYFNYGVAVHGASNVPNHPASHGCVRIPMHIAEYFPDLVHKGDAVYVFDGVKSPETYGRQPPPFDQDITPTTTTTSTTTTVAATTTSTATTTTTVKSSSTSSAPTTTAAPSTTTTVAPTTTGAVVVTTAAAGG